MKEVVSEIRHNEGLLSADLDSLQAKIFENIELLEEDIIAGELDRNKINFLLDTQKNRLNQVFEYTNCLKTTHDPCPNIGKNIG